MSYGGIVRHSQVRLRSLSSRDNPSKFPPLPRSLLGCLCFTNLPQARGVLVVVRQRRRPFAATRSCVLCKCNLGRNAHSPLGPRVPFQMLGVGVTEQKSRDVAFVCCSCEIRAAQSVSISKSWRSLVARSIFAGRCDTRKVEGDCCAEARRSQRASKVVVRLIPSVSPD
jgi:hypothetical protein